MDVYLDIFSHIISSFVVGVVVWKYFYPRDKKKLAIALFFAFLSGFWVDLDHFIDYFFTFSYHFDFEKFISGAMFSESGKNYVFFHAYEYVIILAAVAFFVKNRTKKMIFVVLFLSLFFHLVVDIMFGVPAEEYFLIYRILNNFATPILNV